ncbi:hypothetical protein [uncultured Fibrobacter sp.]|uniref:hypothetical protein n=1 Tax=uncultured Fibrobacter sp. TaxID=261512 RepID=UPI0025F66ED7|nr:hypothetical protein [uncultured Fibrobacter sp.]
MESYQISNGDTELKFTKSKRTAAELIIFNIMALAIIVFICIVKAVVEPVIGRTKGGAIIETTVFTRGIFADCRDRLGASKYCNAQNKYRNKFILHISDKKRLI